MEYVTQKREAPNIMQSAFGERKKKPPSSYKNTFFGLKDLISADESSVCFFTTLPKNEVFKKAFLEANSSIAWVSLI